MEVTKAIRERRSIRKYQAGDIPAEHVYLLLEAAMLAPSAGNCRPWEFIIVRDHAVKEKLMQLHPYCRFLMDAPFAVVICARPELQKKICEGYWPQDCAAAAENLLLQAADLGYGACWCGVYPVEDRVMGFQKVLNVTSIPFALITAGLAGEAPSQHGYYDETRVKVV